MAESLVGICRSLNEGDVAKAAFGTDFLRIPPSFDLAGGNLGKASPEDPKHPGWPAKSPDGQGGEFRPKDDGTVGLTYESKEQRVSRLQARRGLRSIVRRVLTSKRALRLLAEFDVDTIPVLDAASSIATVYDAMKLVEDAVEDTAATKAAIAFAEKGPQTLEDLVVDQTQVSFSSYSAFLKIDLDKRYGSAGDGYQYHHVVEQGPNAALFGQDMMQSTSNIVKIPTLVHESVSAIYNTNFDFGTGRQTLRDFLRGASFERQRAWRLWALQHAGALQ